MGDILSTALYACLYILYAAWFVIGAILFFKNRIKKNYKKIERVFAEIVGAHLYGVGEQRRSIQSIKRSLAAVNVTPGNNKNVQIIIDLMIRTQRMLLGNNHQKLKLLYPQLPPYNTSIKKVRSWYWYNKARGIREIYEMNQSQYLEEVLYYRDHKNIYVRREAQIAIVVFLGWKSLKFLSNVQHNLTLWQQIKIVEKLYDLYPEVEMKFLKSAYRIESYFGKELIIRIIRKFKIQEELGFIIDQLSVSSRKVREAAISCLASFELNENHIANLKNIFHEMQEVGQQKKLLELIIISSGSIEVSFYTGLLNHSDDSIKLISAEFLWNRGYKEEVEQYYYSQYQILE